MVSSKIPALDLFSIPFQKNTSFDQVSTLPSCYPQGWKETNPSTKNPFSFSNKCLVQELTPKPSWRHHGNWNQFTNIQG